MKTIVKKPNLFHRRRCPDSIRVVGQKNKVVNISNTTDYSKFRHHYKKSNEKFKLGLPNFPSKIMC